MCLKDSITCAHDPGRSHTSLVTCRQLLRGLPGRWVHRGPTGPPSLPVQGSQKLKGPRASVKGDGKAIDRGFRLTSDPNRTNKLRPEDVFHVGRTCRTTFLSINKIIFAYQTHPAHSGRSWKSLCSNSCNCARPQSSVAWRAPISACWSSSLQRSCGLWSSPVS